MQSMPVSYQPDTGAIDPVENASPEAWDAVCQRFDNDVRRIKDVNDRDPYTALYACYDEDNQPFYYLVEEDDELMRLRRKTFLRKLGGPQM